jgi:transcription initiation factor TFIID subunit 2
MGEIPNGAVTSSHFQRTCERLGHAKLDTFFNQWVYGAGVPRFQATQRFNKKKLVVEMMIKQVQSDQPSARDLEKDAFMRDVKEEIRNVYAGPIQPVFSGSMTIRIHEADGTPYEHIVEIKDGVTKFDIPYNTKYKRLKRNKRQKERAAAVITGDGNTEVQEDILLYCLGDVLQTEEEMQQWRLADWSKEDEERMGQESYEWIRMDADFEWICKLSLVMPGYMYLSQLQQDRDVVAQLEVSWYVFGFYFC